MPRYETRVGMECHAELLTQSKMFCGCKNVFGGEPNTRTCPVCLGLPGSLPVMNGKAVEHVVRTALALNCTLSLHSLFHRKNYFYPDLPKGYQISQYGDTPIGTGGWLEIEKPDGTAKKIHITRVHLEEDTGKLLHSDGAGYSVVDYNRSGVPLMEIVTAFPPEIESAEEAQLYIETLRALLICLGVSDGKMEQGSLRGEPNISVRLVGADGYGTKTELKNLNSFRAVHRGIEFETERQIAVLERGERVVQETRGWDDERGVSFSQRSKEVEQEYRYFPEPDLIPLDFEGKWLDSVRGTLPELPNARRRRLQEQYGLPAADAAQIVLEREAADFFEAAARGAKDPKAVANWMLGDLARLANAAAIPLHATSITPAALAEMVGLIESGAITGKIAKAVLEEMFASGKTAPRVVAEQGLTVSGADEVAGIVAGVAAAHPDVVARIKAGNDKAIGFLVGQVMKESKGRAKPEDVNRLLQQEIERQ